MNCSRTEAKFSSFPLGSTRESKEKKELPLGTKQLRSQAGEIIRFVQCSNRSHVQAPLTKRMKREEETRSSETERERERLLLLCLIEQLDTDTGEERSLSPANDN